jgi:membrane protein YdbS with pleckstrin-like domain
MVVLWGWLGLTLLYRRMTVRYRLTAYRFFHERGLLARTGDRIQVIAIDDVSVEQGPIDRLLGIGTIVLHARDTTSPTLRLPGIENVRDVADLIDGARRAERNRRGLYTSDMG